MMGRFIQAALAIGTAFAITGCASGPATGPAAQPAPAASALGSRAGGLISAKAYNEVMREQGAAHYCGSGACDTPPALLYAATPRYPKAAQRQRRTGMAAVVFDIEVSGRPSKIELESATHPDFGDAALESVRSWRYAPARLNGKPVKFHRVRQEFPFNF